MRPLGDRVLLRRDPPEEMTTGGIVIPDQARETTTRGTVVAVGKLKDDALAPGHRVLFSRYSGTDIKVDGEELTIVAESDIIGAL